MIKIRVILAATLLFNNQCALGDNFDFDVKNITVTPRPPKEICNISENFIDEMLVDFNIVGHDAFYLGYTSINHIDTQDNSKNNKKNDTLGKYYNQKIAERVITEGIRISKKRIVDWINFIDASPNIRINYDTSVIIGYYNQYSYKHLPLLQLQSSRASIILSKQRVCNFSVLRSFPIINHNDEAEHEL